VTFRDLERPTIDAITLFGDKNTKNVVLEKSYEEYMQGFTDAATGEAKRGFMAVVSELEQRFLTLPVSTVKKRKKPSSNCLVNICGQKTSCKTMMNLPR
jgi:type I restriction enzyme R subunit